MLVFRRKVGDEIVIADNIRVTVLDVSGARVRLGVIAPGQLAIRRGELDGTERVEGERSKMPLRPLRP
jgi:carbon storage regulator